jgi:hypothetical protein
LKRSALHGAQRLVTLQCRTNKTRERACDHTSAGWLWRGAASAAALNALVRESNAALSQMDSPPAQRTDAAVSISGGMQASTPPWVTARTNH